MDTEINPKVWPTNGKIGKTVRAAPVQIQFKDSNIFRHWKQYPLRPKVKKWTVPILNNLQTQGLLICYNSPGKL